MESNNRKFDYISARMNLIHKILDGNNLIPLLELESTETEAFINTTNENDIRKVLKKKVLDFGKVINQIGSKLVYIKSGTTGHTFRGFDPSDPNNPNYAVKVVAYPKRENYGDLNDIRRPENAEIIMLKVLSYFVINNQSPHLILPIGTFNTSIKPFLSLQKNKIVDNKKYSQFIKRYKKGDLHNEVSVLISEWANGGDLLEYIRKNYKTMTLNTWRVLFFQILSVLAVIQAKYPGFRHNDLKANNLLIHHIESRNKNNKFKYKINGKTYIIPNINLQIKLWDFDFACIEGIVDNTKVSADWTNRINVKPKKNRYYDIHYLFNTLTRKGFFPEFYDVPEINKSVKDFFKRIVPEKYRNGDNVAERGRLLVDDEFTTPDDILRNDPFFKRIRPSESN
jgi:serine/threonine protein kinase